MRREIIGIGPSGGFMPRVSDTEYKNIKDRELPVMRDKFLNAQVRSS